MKKKTNDIGEVLRQLDKRSVAVLAKFRKIRDKFDHPFIVEICGTPRSGKTTIIRQTLRRFLWETGWRLSFPQEGAERIETPRNDGFLYNLHTAVYALDCLLHARHNKNIDLVIFDRAIFDAVMRVRFWHEKGEIDNETRDKTTAFYLTPRIGDLIDKYIVLVCSPEAALKREDQFGLTTSRSVNVNEETIKQFLRLHNNVFAQFQEESHDVSMVDTSELDARQEGIIVANLILDAISKI